MRSRSIAIVMYHGVMTETLPSFHWCHLDAADFLHQVEYLTENYRVLSLRELIHRLHTHKPLPDRTAVLTFDDGLRSVATNAFPILERFGLPATVFLVTSYVATDQPPWPDQLYHDLMRTPAQLVRIEGRDFPLSSSDHRKSTYDFLVAFLKTVPDEERLRHLDELQQSLGHWPVHPESPLATMDWAEVECLSRSGIIDFGSHTHTHPILSRCSEEKQYEELRTSRDILYERLGRADLFAYPNGTRADFTNTTKKMLRELSFTCGLATTPGLIHRGADLYELRRVNVGADTRGRVFEARMAGF